MKQTKGVWVIIPAAGSGNRFGSALPKQYLQIDNKTLLEYSIEVFLSQSWVSKIIVPIAQNDPYFSNIRLAHEKVHRIVGGETRMHSIMEAMKYLKPHVKTHDWILTHDAVRPCLHPLDLDRFMAILANHPIGGILAAPVKDTLKFAVNLEISHTVERENLWQALTPQMFRYQWLEKALQYCLENNLPVTDESGALECINMTGQIVEAKFPNPKLTYSSDLDFITTLLRNNKEILTCV